MFACRHPGCSQPSWSPRGRRARVPRRAAGSVKKRNASKWLQRKGIDSTTASVPRRPEPQRHPVVPHRVGAGTPSPTRACRSSSSWAGGRGRTQQPAMNSTVSTRARRGIPGRPSTPRIGAAVAACGRGSARLRRRRRERDAEARDARPAAGGAAGCSSVNRKSHTGCASPRRARRRCGPRNVARPARGMPARLAVHSRLGRARDSGTVRPVAHGADQVLDQILQRHHRRDAAVVGR